MILLQIVVRYMQAEFCMPLVEIFKNKIIVKNSCIDLIYVVLGFIIEWLASAVSFRPFQK